MRAGLGFTLLGDECPLPPSPQAQSAGVLFHPAQPSGHTQGGRVGTQSALGPWACSALLGPAAYSPFRPVPSTLGTSQDTAKLQSHSHTATSGPFLRPLQVRFGGPGGLGPNQMLDRNSSSASSVLRSGLTLE